MWKYLLLWLPMVLIAIVNGVVRQAWYGRHLSELRAHQLSSLIALVLFGFYIRLSLRFFPPAGAAQTWAIGVLWLALTVAFEFGFGHFVAGHSWSRLCQDYNLLAGRLWVLILLWLLVAPSLFYWWRQ
jgi:hypothetical protein